MSNGEIVTTISVLAVLLIIVVLISNYMDNRVASFQTANFQGTNGAGAGILSGIFGAIAGGKK